MINKEKEKANIQIRERRDSDFEQMKDWNMIDDNILRIEYEHIKRARCMEDMTKLFGFTESYTITYNRNVVGKMDLANDFETLEDGIEKISIALDPDYTGLGIARVALENFIEDYFKRKPFNKLRSTVFRFNYPSMKMFTRLGFKELYIGDDGYYKYGSAIDDLEVGNGRLYRIVEPHTNKYTLDELIKNTEEYLGMYNLISDKPNVDVDPMTDRSLLISTHNDMLILGTCEFGLDRETFKNRIK